MYIYRIMLFLVFGGYLLSPLFMDGWGDPSVAWYRPFAIWGVLIALTLWLEQKRKIDGAYVNGNEPCYTRIS